MTVYESIASDTVSSRFRLKDPVSALTHFGGFLSSVFLMPVLLIRASSYGWDTTGMMAFAVFMLSMIILYGASAAYHSFDISPRANLILKKIDHLSIFILIAGSYTPVCICGLGNTKGIILLSAIWITAAAGMVFKLFFVACPRYVSSVVYMFMGWMCLAVLPDLYAALGPGGFGLLLAGGLFYSAGSLIYARKKEMISFPGFGNHELFHCFVLAGSLCHYLFMYLFLIPHL